MEFRNNLIWHFPKLLVPKNIGHSVGFNVTTEIPLVYTPETKVSSLEAII